MYEKWYNVLLKSKMFENFNVEALDRTITCFSPAVKSFKKNENIVIAGEQLTGIGIILKGEAAIVKENFEGSRIIIDILSDGNCFGEIGAFSKERLWPATVVAQENTTVMFIQPSKIVFGCCSRCEGHDKLVENFISMISEKALMLNQKLEYLGIKSLRGRICRFLLESMKKSGSSTFMLSMNRNEFADFLNITRPSLSREMCKMRDEGLIDFHMSSIRLLDLEEIRRNAM